MDNLSIHIICKDNIVYIMRGGELAVPESSDVLSASDGNTVISGPRERGNRVSRYTTLQLDGSAQVLSGQSQFFIHHLFIVGDDWVAQNCTHTGERQGESSQLNTFTLS